MKVLEIIRSTAGNKCPRCHEGKVFVNNNPYSLSNGLTMNKTCNHCHLKYEMETGFFYGAMYVSYGMVAGLFILLFVADLLFWDLEAEVLFAIFSSIILVMFPVTYRWSRLIWMNFFVKYNPALKHQPHSAGNPARAVNLK